MMKKPVTTNAPAEQVVKDIRRATRKLHSSEVNRPGFTGGQNSRRIARYGTDIKEENREAVFT